MPAELQQVVDVGAPVRESRRPRAQEPRANCDEDVSEDLSPDEGPIAAPLECENGGNTRAEDGRSELDRADRGIFHLAPQERLMLYRGPAPDEA